MLKFVCLISLLCVYLTVAQNQFGQGDISSAINNPDFVLGQINCVLEKGPCDRTGKQLKVAIPEVLQRNCKSCNKQQATNARKLISFVQKRYPKSWQEIQKKYHS